MSENTTESNMSEMAANFTRKFREKAATVVTDPTDKIVLLDYISKNAFYLNLIDSHWVSSMLAKASTNQNYFNFMKYCLAITYELSKPTIRGPILDEEVLVPVLLNFARNEAFSDDLALVPYIYLAKVLSTKELALLPNNIYIVDTLVDTTQKFALTLKNTVDKNQCRSTVDLYNEYIQKVETNFVCSRVFEEFSINLVELLETIYLFNIDSAQVKMSLLPHLDMIAVHGNTVECEYALKVLFQFCFDHRFVSDLVRLSGASRFFSALKRLCEKNPNGFMSAYAQSILYLTEQMEDEHEQRRVPEEKAVFLNHAFKDDDANLVAIEASVKAAGFHVYTFKCILPQQRNAYIRKSACFITSNRVNKF